MNILRPFALAAAALILHSSVVFAQAFDPVVFLMRAANADGSPDLGAEEWRTFLEGLGADEAGKVDRLRLKSRLLYRDADGDGTMGRADLEQVLAVRRGGGLFGIVVRELADDNRDGETSAGEARAFAAGTDVDAEGVIGEETLIDWVRRVEKLPPPTDRNAVTAGVFFVSIDTAFDTDASGAITLEELGALHRALDTNADGVISAAEFIPPKPAGNGNAARPNWSVSAESRSRPPGMPWQRNLKDALAVVEATGKPLLLCVNMDGENASEALAFGRYRDPAFVELARGFVCLIASPDRREPRERDDQGRRLPDQRFGRVLNSEHIDIEPTLYERFFGGRRVAPRHVGVAPDGETLFDAYLLQDLSVIDAKLRKFGKPMELPPPSTLSLDGLLMNPDAGCRDELEDRFARGNERKRARLASLALSDVRETQHPELLRMALRDPSEKVRRQGLWTILQHADKAPLDQLPVAVARFGDEPDLRAALLVAMRRIVETSTGDAQRNAAFYLRIFEATGRASAVIDPVRWSAGLSITPPRPELDPGEPELDATAAAMEQLGELVLASPDDAGLLVQQAAAFMRMARIQIAMGQDPTLFFEDVIRACDAALLLAEEDSAALGYRAWASYMLSDRESAAESAARSLPGLARDPGSPLAQRVLSIFTDLRTRELYDAIKAGDEWPEHFVSDAIAAHEARIAHPSAEEAHFRSYLDLLGSLTLHAEQAALVRRAIERFPVSGDLHAYLRFQVLRDEGSRALEAAYEIPPLARVRRDNTAALDWFHGLASVVAAEHDVMNRDVQAALAAYERSNLRFEQSVDLEPGYGVAAAHYQALGLSGAARLLTGLGRLSEAVDFILTSVQIAPKTAELEDGFGKTPRQVARDLRRALARAGEEELSQRLESGLAEAGIQPESGPSAPKQD